MCLLDQVRNPQELMIDVDDFSESNLRGVLSSSEIDIFFCELKF